MKAGDWEKVVSQWTQENQIEPVPPFHTIEKTPDGHSFHVAAAQTFAAILDEHGFAIDKTVPSDVAQPTKTDINVHGAHEANLRAFKSFSQNAVHGVSLGHRFGLDQYYRAITLDQRMLVPIERAILIRDILVSLRCLGLLDLLLTMTRLYLLRVWIYFCYVTFSFPCSASAI